MVSKAWPDGRFGLLRSGFAPDRWMRAIIAGWQGGVKQLLRLRKSGSRSFDTCHLSKMSRQLGEAQARENRRGDNVVPLHKGPRYEEEIGRGKRIRTSGPCLPKTVLYQAELFPDRAGTAFSGGPVRQECAYSEGVPDWQAGIMHFFERPLIKARRPES